MDIAPRFAGTLFGLSNTVGTVSGIVAPFLAAEMTSGGSREEWRFVFVVGAVVLVFGALFYAAFGSGELQSWATRESGTQPSAIALLPTSNSTVTRLIAKQKDNDFHQPTDDHHQPISNIVKPVTFGVVTKFS